MKNLLYLLFIQLVMVTSAKAQNELKIGDQVPNTVIDKILTNTGEISSSNLSTYKDQLLILDLMNTGCSGCIEGLLSKNKLQKQFGDKVKIMVVTKEKEDYIRKFLNNPKTILSREKVTLPWVVEDSILDKYFPHQFISHLVWIYKGKVIGLTAQEYVDQKNIQAVLEGKPAFLPLKTDIIDYDYNTPIFSLVSQAEKGNSGTLIEKSILGNYSLVAGHQNGFASNTGFVVDSAAKHSRIYSINVPIITTFARAYSKIHEFGTLPVIVRGRLILEGQDISKYFYLPEYGYSELWSRKNDICYEATFDSSMDEKACYEQMIADLNRYLGIHARWEKRTIPALVIVAKNGKEAIAAKSKAALLNSYYNENMKLVKGKDSSNLPNMVPKKYKMRNLELDYSLMSLLKRDTSFLPLVDASGYTGEFYFTQGNYIEDLASFKKALQDCGFDLVERPQETLMFVVTEKDWKAKK